MTKYIVKEHLILYKEVEADSPQEAEEIAMGEPVNQAEEYIEVEEGELLWLISFQWHVTLGVKDTQVH